MREAFRSDEATRVVAKRKQFSLLDHKLVRYGTPLWQTLPADLFAIYSTHDLELYISIYKIYTRPGSYNKQVLWACDSVWRAFTNTKKALQ